MKRKKIVIVGNFNYSIYEYDLAEAMSTLGLEVIEFSFKEYLRDSIIGKIENHFSFIGSKSTRAINDLSRILIENQPAYCFMWRYTLISKKHLIYLKTISSNTLFISYNNDNPFGVQYNTGWNLHNRFVWRHFLACIEHHDINLVYRPSNIVQYNRYKSKTTLLFPPSFVESKLPSFIEDRSFDFDLIFVGHYVPRRADFINALLRVKIDVKIFGTGWRIDDLDASYKYGEIKSIEENAYYEVLSKSKIALAFLSELNEDVYTRRNFEITACGTLMLSERTKELTELFIEDEEAVFFSSENELLSKARFLLNDINKIKSIGKKARSKSFKAGYDLVSRARNLLKEIEKEDI